MTPSMPTRRFELPYRNPSPRAYPKTGSSSIPGRWDVTGPPGGYRSMPNYDIQ